MSEVSDGGSEIFRHEWRERAFERVVPIHRDEMDLKLRRGFDALVALLDDHGVDELLDPGRPSVVDRRRRPLFRR